MHPLIIELGLNGEPKLLHERRGTTFYKVGDTALKITEDLMAGREGQVLAALAADHYQAHGDYGQGTWLTMRWIDGTNLWDALEPAYRGDATPAARRSILTAAAEAAEALAELHAAGWTHGDLQPDHLVFEGGAVRIIDLACAQGPVPVPYYPHRGGRAETTAPEIASLILDTTDHITTTPEADVWSLAASLFWSWTRIPPTDTDYHDLRGGRPGQLAVTATGRRHDLAAVRPWPFPPFEAALRAGLAQDPGQRPSARSLSRLLRAALPESARVREYRRVAARARSRIAHPAEQGSPPQILDAASTASRPVHPWREASPEPPPAHWRPENPRSMARVNIEAKGALVARLQALHTDDALTTAQQRATLQDIADEDAFDFTAAHIATLLAAIATSGTESLAAWSGKERQELEDLGLLRTDPGPPPTVEVHPDILYSLLSREPVPDTQAPAGRK